MRNAESVFRVNSQESVVITTGEIKRSGSDEESNEGK
jgi:hypothetical protein